MIRVMQINQGENFGGVSAMLYHFYQHIDRTKVQFDFVAPRHSSFSIHRKEIEEMGGRIIELNADGNLLARKIRFWERLKQHIQKEQYEVVHINSGNLFFNIQCAKIAKECHVRKIIVHSHNAGTNSGLKQKSSQFFKPLLDNYATDFFSCSHKAAEFMFTSKRIKNKQYKVINNGIDTDRFTFDMEKRNRSREQLHLSEEETLIHVGRFSKQKNHVFLIQLFQKYIQLYPNSVLLLVGTGELEKEIKRLASEAHLDEHVKFLGLRQDIPELMSASDVFVLPSLYEGLPVVGIEAQANGLPCIFSDPITKETNVLNHNVFLSLNADLNDWCKAIHEAVSQNISRETSASAIAEKGYSIQAVSEYLQNFYLS